MTKLELLKHSLNEVQKDIDDGLDYGGPAPKSLYDKARSLKQQIEEITRNMSSDENYN